LRSHGRAVWTLDVPHSNEESCIQCAHAIEDNALQVAMWPSNWKMLQGAGRVTDVILVGFGEGEGRLRSHNRGKPEVFSLCEPISLLLSRSRCLRRVQRGLGSFLLRTGLSDIPLSTLQRLLEKHRFQHALCNPHPFPRRGQGMANPGGLSGRVLLCILTGPALLSQGAHETIE
jgi:hypothetical protein